MNPFPPNWTTGQLAYFAGLITAQMRLGTVKEITAKFAPLRKMHGESTFFVALVKRLKPLVREDQWQGCIETVERIWR